MTGRAEGPPASTTEESVEVRHDGHVVATAKVSASEPHGTATVALSTPHDPVPAGARSELVDQVMERPGVRNSETVRVVVPLGDSESISRLQEHTTNVNARAAGASSVIEAEVARPASDD